MFCLWIKIKIVYFYQTFKLVDQLFRLDYHQTIILYANMNIITINNWQLPNANSQCNGGSVSVSWIFDIILKSLYLLFTYIIIIILTIEYRQYFQNSLFLELWRKFIQLL